VRVSEHFTTIQGEGRHAGVPVYLIRLFGCNLKCKFCDAKHTLESERNPVFMFHKYSDLTPTELANWIGVNEGRVYLWTGGEPMLQISEILETIELLGHDNKNHLETNGTILSRELLVFDYISFSPKDKSTAGAVEKFLTSNHVYGDKYEIKVVTDLKSVGAELIDYATTLMPLTTGDDVRDAEIRRNVWGYCADHCIRYSPRLQLGVELV